MTRRLEDIWTEQLEKLDLEEFLENETVCVGCGNDIIHCVCHLNIAG